MISNFSSKLFAIIVLLAILLLAFIVGPFYYFNSQIGNKIYPHTSIDGIDMGNKTKKEAFSLLKSRDTYLNNVAIQVMYHDAPVATFSAEQINIHRDSQSKVDQAYIVGRTPHFPSRIYQQLNAMLGVHSIKFQTTMTYDRGPIEKFVMEAQDTYNKPARDALFKFENGKVTSFKSHENGLSILNKEFLAETHSEIQKIGKNTQIISIKLKEEIIKPKVTLAEANNNGIEELIGIGISDYSHSIPTRIHNVILAANKFNGVLIPKGKEFSFVDIIGDISSNTGYQPAYVIQNGRTVLGDGGGVCQVSTTVFRAALNSGLPITERHAHAYRVGYYENDSQPGFDATIFSPSVDFKFKNDTPADILIQTEIDEDNNILTFKFYGKKDDRKVEISPVTVWDIAAPPEPLYEDDPTIPNGQVKQVDYAAWGAKAKFTYRVTKGTDIAEETFMSSYRPWKAVFLRGTGST